jgi:predicted phage terminase large subunit-like protein
MATDVRPLRFFVEGIADGLETLNASWRETIADTALEFSRGYWQPYPYLMLISQLLSVAVREGDARFIVLLPPRHGKSELISKWAPVWFLSNNPTKRIILTTYEADFAASWGRKVRDIINENSGALGINMRRDSSAGARWDLAEGGGMQTAGVGGAITGKGGDLIIIDDAVKNYEQAMSPTYRKKSIEWFHSTLYTRREPGASVVLLMTRWHELDLGGHLIEEYPKDWVIIRLPAIAEEGDLVGREPGEALCPERFPLQALEPLRDAKGELEQLVWHALYQQTPRMLEGGIFKRSWWKFYEKLPPKEEWRRVVQYWDTAVKDEEDNAYSVCTTWIETETAFYLKDVFRDKLQMPDLMREAQMQYNLHKPSAVVIEDKSSGQSLIQLLRQKTRIPVIADEVEKDKEYRARLVTPSIEAGNVLLPARKLAPWITIYLEEFDLFPNGEYADQVDSTTGALRYLLGLVGNEPNVRFFPDEVPRNGDRDREERIWHEDSALFR